MEKTGFDGTWHKYHPRILSYVARMSRLPIEEAENLTQEIFLKIIRVREHADTPNLNNSSWYFTIARNHIIDWVRKQPHHEKAVPLEPHLYRLESRHPGPEETLLKKDLSEQVETYLNTLPIRDREISFLKFSEGWPDRAIANHLEIPTGTVKYRIHRIRWGLKQYLEE